MTTIAATPKTVTEDDSVSKRMSALEFAADALERALHEQFFTVKMQLIYAVDSGTLDPVVLIKQYAEKLIEQAEEIESRLEALYPQSRSGRAARLVLQVKNLGIAREIDYYRQEQFWRGDNQNDLIRSEELIRDLYRFYREVATLVRYLDSEAEHPEANRDFPDLKRTANPYHEIIAD